MEIQDLQDQMVIEENLVKMEYQVHLVLWEKRVLQEVMDHLDFQATKDHQENRVTPDCLDLREEEVDRVLQDQLAQLVSEEVEDNVAPLVKLESLDYLANQAHKVQGEEMDQRDPWENLENLDHKVFLGLLENQVLLDLLGLQDLLVKPKLFHKQSAEVKVCQDLQELMDPWVLLVRLENVELVELVVQREALECLESLEVLVGQEDQAHPDKLVLLEPLEKMENPDENTVRMISEKFVHQSYETVCLNLLLDCQDLLEDLVVDIVDQLGRLVPEVQLEILESREKLDKEVSQDYQECLELLGLLDPKENVVISVIPVY